MKTSITLELKTREVHHLFTRKIKGDRLFIDAILHKLNGLAGQQKKGSLASEELYQVTQERLNKLAQQFEDQTEFFLRLIQKNPLLKNKTITVKAQFFPQICIDNQLTFSLIKLIQQYDTLISTIKLLHLAGCFENTQTYYENIKSAQASANYTLSQIITASTIQ